MGVTLQHLGDLHAYEQLMVVLLAFGPLLLLVATVVVARRRDAGDGVEEPGASPREGEDPD